MNRLGHIGPHLSGERTPADTSPRVGGRGKSGLCGNAEVPVVLACGNATLRHR